MTPPSLTVVQGNTLTVSPVLVEMTVPQTQQAITVVEEGSPELTVFGPGEVALTISVPPPPTITAGGGVQLSIGTEQAQAGFGYPDVSKGMTWVDGRLTVVSDSYGTKTLSYDEEGRLISIAGTGVYPASKSFVYDEFGRLTSTLVIAEA